MDSAKTIRNLAWKVHKKIQSLLRPTFISVNGYSMFLDKGDSTGYSTKEYEKETTEIIKKEVKENNIVIDLGANIGYYTLLLSKIVGENGKVFAFEPEDKNFEILKRNVELNRLKNVVLIKKAVIDKVGEDNLYLDPKYIGSHVMYNEFIGKKPVKVETTTLDEFFKDFKGKINFIKMDIDGSEIRALKGMTSLIKNNKIKMIADYAPSRIRETGSSPEEYLEIIKNLGFNYKLIKDNNDPTVGNLFCCRK
jgi:FkbM family methyltransferase